MSKGQFWWSQWIHLSCRKFCGECSAVVLTWFLLQAMGKRPRGFLVRAIARLAANTECSTERHGNGWKIRRRADLYNFGYRKDTAAPRVKTRS